MYKSILVICFTILASLIQTESKAQDKILMVVTNNKEVQATVAGKDTVLAGGYTVSEVSEAHQVFTKSGFQVDFLSPEGGKTYPEMDEEMSELDKEFLNTSSIRKELDHTYAPSEVSASDYAAIYFAGGKTLFDFPYHSELGKLITEIYESNGIVGAVCHGPAALLGVTLSDGTPLIEGKQISGFTNMEEQLFSKTAKYYPFLLQDELTKMGAKFVEAPAMFRQMVSDSRIVTGQNPVSSYAVAEEMVRSLGKTPPPTPWSDLSYTLEIIRKVILEDVASATEFQLAHENTNTINLDLILQYGAFGHMGNLGETVQKNSIQLLEYAARTFPENARAHEELGKAYYRDGNTAKAIASLKQSNQLKPDTESVVTLLQKLEES
ncbi:DJ-1/PfpI family protein [Balneola sp. MJW-20]|uniref:DJ-1/PfpI family protein n=1 Tax=Gracilimonas aurantiaca TaxID=3234185 RepID=UPI003466A8B3